MPFNHVRSAERAALLSSALLLAACRSYDPNLLELDGGAVDGGGSGDDACTDAASCVPEMCSAPDGSTARLFDCDHSELTACETDVSFHPYHCGGCDQPCDDLCQNSQCMPVERLLERVDYDAAQKYKRYYLHAVSDRHVYAVVLSEELERSSLVRVSRSTGQVETILGSLDQDISELAVGTDRVYLLSASHLNSIPQSGEPTLRLEAENVTTMAADGERLAWLDSSDSHIHASNTLTGTNEDLGEIPDVVMLSLHGSSLAVLAQRFLARSHVVWARSADEQPLDKLAEPSVLGEIIKAHGDEVLVLENDGEVYPVVRYSIDGKRELGRYEMNKEIWDFAVDDTHFYAAFKEFTSAGIEVRALQNPGYRAISGMAAPVNGIILEGRDLYFMQGQPPALLRIETSALKY